MDHTKAGEEDYAKADLREEARVGGKRVWSGGDVLAGGYGRGGLNGGLNGGHGELSDLHGGPSEHVKANRTKAGEAYQIQPSEHVKGVVLANLNAHQKQV